MACGSAYAIVSQVFLALPGVVVVALAIHTGSALLGFHLRVVFGEEPSLARTPAATWEEYKAKALRWLL